jgi:hypothetical protein
VYAYQLEAYNRALEQGDAVMREALARIAQGDWSVRVRQLPPNHPRYAMVSLFAQVLQRIARVRAEMDTSSTVGMKAQVDWERVSRHVGNLMERTRRAVSSGASGQGFQGLDDVALVAQLDTGYAAADGTLHTLQLYLTSCQ